MAPIDYLHNPPNVRDIKELWGFFSVDQHGLGLVASTMPGIGITPLVTGNPKLIEDMKKIAAQVAEAAGKEVRMYHFVRDGEHLWSAKP